jgi:N-acetylglucosaminyldiphosphoundecaprenol N-acetyl-beta-D-mannosaminyltransferase
MTVAVPRRANLLGVLVSATDDAEATRCVIAAARARQPLGLSAAAVHAIMEAHLDPAFGAALNRLDLVVPDGQPVRWGLSLTRQARLQDRVYGPTLTLHVCEAAAREGLPVFFYGSTRATLARLTENLARRFPGLAIAGAQPSRFRDATPAEQAEDAAAIVSSGARVVFVGLGCPRQEWWVFHHVARLSLPVLAVGAAFDFHAGTMPQAPGWMQRAGLEWAFRLRKEPRRLWRRYAKLNPLYVLRLGQQVAMPERFAPHADEQAARRRPCPG